jgi:hypothetical protein
MQNLCRHCEAIAWDCFAPLAMTKEIFLTLTKKYEPKITKFHQSQHPSLEAIPSQQPAAN